MASESTVLSWTFSNWVSVIIMAGIGFAVLGLAMKIYQSKTQSNS